MNRLNHGEGFTLLEVLIAMVILEITMVLVISLFSSGLGLVRETNRHSSAVLLAIEKMDEELIAGDIEEGIKNGMSSDYRWEKNVTPYLMPEDQETESHLFQVEVKVAWEESLKKKEVVLRSLVTARPSGQGLGNAGE